MSTHTFFHTHACIHTRKHTSAVLSFGPACTRACLVQDLAAAQERAAAAEAAVQEVAAAAASGDLVQESTALKVLAPA